MMSAQLRSDSRRIRPHLKALNFSISDVVVGLMAVLVFCLRPSAVGEIYSFQVSILLVCLIVVYLLVNRDGFRFSPSPIAICQLALVFIVVFQVAAHAAAAGGDFAVNAPKALAMSIAAVGALFIAVINEKNSRIFFSALAALILLICLSTVITSLILMFGVRWTSIIVDVNDQTVYGKLNVLFPYTLSFNIVPTPFGLQPRLSGLFREPGILPPFACWAAAYAHLRRWPLAISAVALGGSIVSLSTLGVPLAAFTGALIMLRRLGLGTWSALGIVTLLGLFTWPVLYALDNVGLKDKIQSQAGSFEARRDAIFTALSGANLLFGDGPSLNYTRDATVNLIGNTRSIGVFGVVVMLTAHALPFWKSIFVIGVLPMVATFLITQPIAGDAAVLAISLSWTAFTRRG